MRLRKTARSCREILAAEASLWTFAETEGVEPTNNAAERAVRHAVCWRKTSYGTDSERGSRFVERMLTAVASCRAQGRGVLDFFTRAIATHGGQLRNRPYSPKGRERLPAGSRTSCPPPRHPHAYIPRVRS